MDGPADHEPEATAPAAGGPPAPMPTSNGDAVEAAAALPSGAPAGGGREEAAAAAGPPPAGTPGGGEVVAPPAALPNGAPAGGRAEAAPSAAPSPAPGAAPAAAEGNAASGAAEEAPPSPSPVAPPGAAPAASPCSEATGIAEDAAEAAGELGGPDKPDMEVGGQSGEGAAPMEASGATGQLGGHGKPDLEMGKQSGEGPTPVEACMGYVEWFQAGLAPYREGSKRYVGKMKPWREFFRASVPHKGELKQRACTNPLYFRINHETIFLLLVLVIDWKGFVVALVLAFIWMLFLMKNDDPKWEVKLGPVEVGPQTRWFLLAAATAAVLVLEAQLWEGALLKALLITALVVLLHSLLHPVPQDFSKASLKEMVPEWTYAGAEKAVCSGICLAIPCCDPVAPNLSGCGCMPLVYSQVACDFDYFFQEVLPRLHTGDIFLSSWPSKPGEWAETGRCMQRTRWTHVGMVYRPADAPEILHSRDRIFGDQVHESRPMIAQMLVYGEMGFRDGQGFELVDLETWVKDFLDKHSHCTDPDSEGTFHAGVRLLENFERDEAFYSAVQAKIDAFWHVPYETQDITMAAVDLCDCLPGVSFAEMKSDDSSLFCSEMVAEVYKATGLLSKDVNGAEFIPKNFDSTSWLWLQRGARLSPEYVLSSAETLAEREARGYRNRGGPDPLSKDRFGAAGFWGVAAGAALPAPPPPVPPPGQAAMAPRPPGQGGAAGDPLLAGAGAPAPGRPPQ